MIDELSKLGFCLPYTEVTKYKESVVKSTNADDILSSMFIGNFTQFVADNIAHNIRTLDGKETFHGMVMIAKPSNPEHELVIKDQPVQRPKNVFKSKDVVTSKGVPVNW